MCFSAPPDRADRVTTCWDPPNRWPKRSKPSGPTQRWAQNCCVRNAKIKAIEQRLFLEIFSQSAERSCYSVMSPNWVRSNQMTGSLWQWKNDLESIENLSSSLLIALAVIFPPQRCLSSSTGWWRIRRRTLQYSYFSSLLFQDCEKCLLFQPCQPACQLNASVSADPFFFFRCSAVL